MHAVSLSWIDFNQSGSIFHIGRPDFAPDWVKEFADDPRHASLVQEQITLEQLEIPRLKRIVFKLDHASPMLE